MSDFGAHSDCNIFGACPGEILHLVLLGWFKYVVQFFFQANWPERCSWKKVRSTLSWLCITAGKAKWPQHSTYNLQWFLFSLQHPRSWVCWHTPDNAPCFRNFPLWRDSRLSNWQASWSRPFHCRLEASPYILVGVVGVDEATAYWPSLREEVGWCNIVSIVASQGGSTLTRWHEEQHGEDSHGSSHFRGHRKLWSSWDI